MITGFLIFSVVLVSIKNIGQFGDEAIGVLFLLIHKVTHVEKLSVLYDMTCVQQGHTQWKYYFSEYLYVCVLLCQGRICKQCGWKWRCNGISPKISCICITKERSRRVNVSFYNNKVVKRGGAIFVEDSDYMNVVTNKKKTTPPSLYISQRKKYRPAYNIN